MSEDKFNTEAFAKTYHNFSSEPLSAENFQQFGLESLTYDALNRIIGTIEKGGRFQKMFIIGHSGCGKSTILNKIARDKELNSQKQIIHFSIMDELNLIDAETVDILFIIYMQMLKAMPSAMLEPPWDKFEDFTGNIREIFEIRETGPDLIPAFSFRIRTDSKFRKALRNNINENIESLQNNIENICRKFSSRIYNTYKITERNLARLQEEDVSEKILAKLKEMEGEEYKSELQFIRTLENKIGEVQLMHYKPVILKHTWIEGPVDPLIIIDDTDKLMKKNMEKIFFEESHLIKMMEAKILFVLPLSAYYSPLFFHIRDYFASEFIRPFQLYDMSGNFQDETFELLSEMVEKRMEGKLISDDALKYLISSSGGLLRDMVHILQDACKCAIAGKKSLIDMDIAQNAVLDMSAVFRPFIDFSEYGDILEKIMKTRNKTGIINKNLTHLLRYHFIIEYGTEETPPWYDLHPCLKELLNRKE